MTNYKCNSYSPQDVPLVFLVELVLREKGVEAQMAMFEKLGKALGPTYALKAIGHTMQNFWGSGSGNLSPSPEEAILDKRIEEALDSPFDDDEESFFAFFMASALDWEQSVKLSHSKPYRFEESQRNEKEGLN